MPAKKKLLPAPCPICHLSNGTLNLSRSKRKSSWGQIIVKIGHYSSVKYVAIIKSRKATLDKTNKDPRVLHIFVLNEENLPDFVVRKSYPNIDTLELTSSGVSKIKREGWDITQYSSFRSHGKLSRRRSKPVWQRKRLNLGRKKIELMSTGNSSSM